MITLMLLRSSIATLVAWAGGCVGAVVGTGAMVKLNTLINVSLGALMAVTVFDILPDAGKLVPLSWFVVAAGTGAFLFWFVGKYLYPVCPACSISSAAHSVAETQIGRAAILLMLALGLHSFMDGAAVVIGDQIDRGANVAVFLAVSLHKFPEGIALVLLLIGAGYARRPALFWTIGIETTTELGALAALLLVGRLSRFDLGLIFANIGGGFAYLVVTAFASQVVREGEDGATQRYRSFLSGGCGFAAAAATMALGEVFAH